MKKSKNLLIMLLISSMSNQILCSNTFLNYAGGTTPFIHLIGSLATEEKNRFKILNSIELAVKDKVDLNLKSLMGESPLMRAALQSKTHNSVFKLLVENGAKVDDQDNSGDSVIMRLARTGHADLLGRYIGGIDVNKKDRCGRTALMDAATRLKIDCMKVLLEHAADIDAQDNAGTTALMLVAMLGKKEDINAKKAIAFLIENGANPNIKDKGNRTYKDYLEGRVPTN